MIILTMDDRLCVGILFFHWSTLKAVTATKSKVTPLQSNSQWVVLSPSTVTSPSSASMPGTKPQPPQVSHIEALFVSSLFASIQVYVSVLFPLVQIHETSAWWTLNNHESKGPVLSIVVDAIGGATSGANGTQFRPRHTIKKSRLSA